MLGEHLIKTWSSSQQAYALSSAEAELYAMVEAVGRGRQLVHLAQEVGFVGISSTIQLFTDSSAAKSFASRRGVGKMRDLWIQKEVSEGRVKLEKIRGDQNPADLMTKILGRGDIERRLTTMNLRMIGDIGDNCVSVVGRNTCSKRGRAWKVFPKHGA